LPRFRSLGSRLIVWIVTTAVLTIATFVVLVLLRADRGLAEQTAQLSRLSEEKLNERLEGDARLARSSIVAMLDDISRRFATMAQRADIVKAVISKNTVAISEILKPALAASDVDGVIVVDAKLGVLGAHDLGVDILEANKNLPQTALSGAVADVIASNDRANRRGFRLKTHLDPVLGAAIGTQSSGSLAEVMIEPVFDDFGDVVAVLIGHRLLKAEEPVLQEFFAMTGRSIAVLSNGGWVAGAGIRPSAAALLGLRTDASAEADEPRDVFRCVELWSDAVTCALASVSELRQLTNQLVEIGHSQARALTFWLLVLAASSIVAFVVTCLLISRQITRPLVQITRAVAAGAKGEWEVPITGTARGDEVGDIARAVEVFKKNAMELLASKTELERTHLQLDVALNNMTHGLCMFDAGERLIVCNAPFVQLYDLPPRLTRRGTPLQAILEHGAAGDRPPRPEIRSFNDDPAADDTEVSVFIQELRDGRTISISRQPMPDGGWVAVHEDITERRRADEEITRLARTDILTGLPNRMVLRETIRHGLQSCAAERPLAVFYLDLDHFKTVNDTLGHPMGDALLKAVAQRIEEFLGEDELVSRLGGDEFAIVELRAGSHDEMSAKAAELVEILSEPYHVQGHELVLGTSIGIALAPKDANDPDDLLKCADLALYKAKAEGRRTFRFFEPELDSQLRLRRALEGDLRAAFAKEEFSLVYQPIITLETNRVRGFEALLRWQHPEKGFIPPDKFIPIAEEIGLIVPITEWVLRTACAEARNWPSHIHVAVNLSPVQFRRRHPLQPIINALAATGLPAGRLEVELTESVFLQAEKSTVEALHELRSFGVRVAMDDFGTGYSALSYLRSFPFNKIKIDRSFVSGLGEPDSEAIVELIVKLAAKLKMSTVAEGVETAEQAEQLRRLGCTGAQGYFFSRPVPPAQIADVIAQCEAHAGPLAHLRAGARQ
jgi:diguanylate cyclase (GGDEF)-like protein